VEWKTYNELRALAGAGHGLRPLRFLNGVRQ
jgi:hypothetical protein